MDIQKKEIHVHVHCMKEKNPKSKVHLFINFHMIPKVVFLSEMHILSKVRKLKCIFQSY